MANAVNNYIHINYMNTLVHFVEHFFPVTLNENHSSHPLPVQYELINQYEIRACRFKLKECICNFSCDPELNATVILVPYSKWPAGGSSV